MSQSTNPSEQQTSGLSNQSTNTTVHEHIKNLKMKPIEQKNLRELGLIPEGERYQAIVKRFAKSYGFATIQNGPYAGIDVLVHQNALITSSKDVYRKLSPNDYIECMVTQQTKSSNNTEVTTEQEDDTTSNTVKKDVQYCATYVTGPNAGLLRCELLHQNRNNFNKGRKYPITNGQPRNKAVGGQRTAFGRGNRYWNSVRPVIVHNHYNTAPPQTEEQSSSNTKST